MAPSTASAWNSAGVRTSTSNAPFSTRARASTPDTRLGVEGIALAASGVEGADWLEAGTCATVPSRGGVLQPTAKAPRSTIRSSRRNVPCMIRRDYSGTFRSRRRNLRCACGPQAPSGESHLDDAPFFGLSLRFARRSQSQFLHSAPEDHSAHAQDFRRSFSATSRALGQPPPKRAHSPKSRTNARERARRWHPPSELQSPVGDQSEITSKGPSPCVPSLTHVARPYIMHKCIDRRGRDVCDLASRLFVVLVNDLVCEKHGVDTSFT